MSFKQDLVFFKDNTLIPDVILQSESLYLSVISQVQGTSAAWLVNSLLENALIGTAGSINNDLKKVPNRSKVSFVSFRNNAEFYYRNGKKNGLDLEKLKNFTYLDYFSDLFTTTIKNPANAIKEVNLLFDKIIQSIQADVIFLEAPELLLLATNINANELLFNITRLNKSCKQLFVIASQDSPQFVDTNATNPQDPAFKVTEFLTKLYHRSQLNIQLKPLVTGRADDISGSLSVSNGSIGYDFGRVLENEYIYHITKDAVKIFFR